MFMSKFPNSVKLLVGAILMATILGMVTIASCAPATAEITAPEEPTSSVSTNESPDHDNETVHDTLSGHQSEPRAATNTPGEGVANTVARPEIQTLRAIIDATEASTMIKPLAKRQTEFPAPLPEVISAFPTPILSVPIAQVSLTTLPVLSVEDPSTIFAQNSIGDPSPATTNDEETTEPAPIDYSKVKVLESVPWDAPIQKQILEDVCGGDIEKFVMLMAVAKNESQFDTTVVGDNGKSFGPYQIKADCHRERIAKYNLTIEDLHDPVKSAYVALDYLEEIKAGRGVSTMAHEVYVVYNAGHYTTNSKVSERADRVMDNYNRFMAEYNETINTHTGES